MRRQAVVLAGGRATRLGPLAATTPKYLLPVAGEPFAHLQLRRLAAAGYDEVVLCIGHLGEVIREALGEARFGLTLIHADEGEAALGTGGALRAARPHLDETFLVTYGDSLLPFDYAEPLDDLRAHPEAWATMSVYENGGRIAPSNARVDGDRVLAYRKGVADPAFRHIDYGAIALRREALARLPEGRSDLATLLERLAAAGQLRALLAHRRFYEIGSVDGLEALEEALADPERFP